jgi:hypothetical protein
MRIRYSVQGKYEKQKATSVIDDLERRFHRLKSETLREFFSRVKETAIENILENNEETNVPLTGNLEDSIDYTVSKGSGRIWAGGPGVPYAAAHNQPVGTTTLILPTHGKFLVFYNHRTGAWSRRTFVLKPGIAFFTRAWESHMDEIPEIAADIADNNF